MNTRAMQNLLSGTTARALDSSVSEAFFATASFDGTSATTGAGAGVVSGFDCSSAIAVGLERFELRNRTQKQSPEAE